MIIPDGIEPVVALRSWYLGENGTLLSMNHSVWTPREPMEAKCERRGSPMHGFSARGGGKTYSLNQLFADDEVEQHTPGEDCSCGIYAAKEISLALSYFNSSCVIGEVYMWGKVIEGTQGWRSQFAYPKRLFFQTLKPSILDFFGLDRDFPSYVAWQEYEKAREIKTRDVKAPYMRDYGVELLPLSTSEIKELKL